MTHQNTKTCNDEQDEDNILSSQVSSIEDLGDLSSYLDLIENTNQLLNPEEHHNPPSNYIVEDNTEDVNDQESVSDESEYTENQGSVPRLDLLMNQEKDIPESSPFSFYPEQRQHFTFDGSEIEKKDYINLDTCNMDTFIKTEQPCGVLTNNLHNYEMMSSATVKSERGTPSPASTSTSSYVPVIPSQTSAKRGRRRKKFSDEEKRQRRKQQNREAAERCRMKRKDHQKKIKQEYDQLKKSHDLLESQLRAKEEKYNKLETTFRQHMAQCRANVPRS